MSGSSTDQGGGEGRSAADVPGAALTVGRPFLREAVVHDIVALDAEHVLDELGDVVGVVAVDRLLEKIGHAVRLTHAGDQPITRAGRPKPSLVC
jgi:hypothetical protein